MTYGKALSTLILVLTISFVQADDFMTQRFDINDSGKRINHQPSYIVINEQVDRNADGKYYDRLFSFASYSNDQPANFHIKILDSSTSKVLLDQSSPQFDLVFEDPETGLLALVSPMAIYSYQIWIIDNHGDIVYRREIPISLFEEFEEIQNESFEKFTGRTGAIEETSLKSSSKNSSLTNEAPSEEEDQDKVYIKIACGVSENWMTKLNSINVDRYGRVTSLTYSKLGKVQHLNLALYETFLLEKISQLKARVETNYPQECQSNENKNSKDSDFGYSRWCESESGSGFAEFWEYHFEENTTLNSSSFKLIRFENIYRSRYGRIENGSNEGIWYVANLDEESLFFCHYKDGLLEGNCEEHYEDDSFITKFQAGVAHGFQTEAWGDEIIYRCNYYSGYRNGSCAYFDNGKTAEECIYDGKNQKGVCTEYHEKTGSMLSVCEKYKDMFHGQCTYYDETGLQTKSSYFQYDEEVWSQKELN